VPPIRTTTTTEHTEGPSKRTVESSGLVFHTNFTLANLIKVQRICSAQNPKAVLILPQKVSQPQTQMAPRASGRPQTVRVMQLFG